MMRLALAISLLTVSAPALAGKCDALIGKASSLEGPALVSTYKKVLQCDKGEAEGAYIDFLKQSGDADTLIALSLAAIDGKAYDPVWNSLDKIKDYSARDQVASGIGQACTEHEEVVVFLKGAYFGLRDIQFAQWDDAYASCPSEDVGAWLEDLVVKPPAQSYNEKYNTILAIWVKRKGKDGLDAMATAAIAAAGNNGPLASVLESMDRAVAPAYGAEMSADDQAALEAALVKVASNVQPAEARLVADKLYNAGSESQAASLLPKVYPDRVQGDGSLLYGAASVESCDKQAVIHYATVSEPAKRWSIITDVEAPTRGYKARLKCTPDGEWPVLATPEPVSSEKEVEAWVSGLEAEWASKGFEVKTRSEGDIDLK